MDDDWGHPHGHGKPHFPNISQCTEPMKHEAWNHQHENRHLSPFHHHFPASETAQHPSTLMPSSPHHPGTTSGAASLCHISWLNPISLAYVIRSASFRCHFSISSFTGKPRWHSKSVCGHFNIKSPSCHHLRHLRHHLSTMDSPFDSPRKKKQKKNNSPFDSPSIHVDSHRCTIRFTMRFTAPSGWIPMFNKWRQQYVKLPSASVHRWVRHPMAWAPRSFQLQWLQCREPRTGGRGSSKRPGRKPPETLRSWCFSDQTEIIGIIGINTWSGWIHVMETSSSGMTKNCWRNR